MPHKTHLFIFLQQPQNQLRNRQATVPRHPHKKLLLAKILNRTNLNLQHLIRLQLLQPPKQPRNLNLVPLLQHSLKSDSLGQRQTIPAFPIQPKPPRAETKPTQT